jgi:EmrB/QacA subfamily drug resistance transporter
VKGNTGDIVSKRVTLIVTSVAQFSLPFMLATINTALPVIGKELEMEAVLLGWVSTSYLLATAAFLIPIGRLADIYGRRKVFLTGLYIAATASIFCAIFDSAVWLIVFRVLQGVGGAMMVSTSIAILTSVFPDKERGKALGISVAAVYLAISVAPFIGGVLTQHLGWRSIFFLSAFLCLVTLVLALLKLKGEWVEAKGEKFDLVGSVAFGASLIIILYGFSVLTTPLGIALIFIGILGMLLFIRWETRVKSPVFNIGLFRRNVVFIFSNLSALINYSAVYAVAFLLSLYLQYIKGLSPQSAGLVLMSQPVLMVIFAPIAGRLSDRIEPRAIASVGMAFCCVALLLFVFLNEDTGLLFIIGSLAIMGLGMGFFSTPNTNAIMGSVAKNLLGVTSGTVATMRSCGQTLSMGVIMIIFSIYIGNAQITPEYYPAFLISVKAGFVVLTVLCFGGIFTQMTGRKVKLGAKQGQVAV